MSHMSPLTSIYGRRLALSPCSSGLFGTSKKAEFLIGPVALVSDPTTAETTGTTLPAWGVSNVPGTSVASTPVYVIDPPIPGVEKTVFFQSTDSNVYVRTLNGETMLSTMGSSFTTLRSSYGGVCKLVGLTTSIWGLLNVTSGTSSNAPGISVSTST